MARTLKEATKDMKGVGRQESIALASYLQRSVLRTEHLLEDIIESGIIENMKRGSSVESQKMLNRVVELANEAKGKSAAETTEINGRMNVIIKALEKSGKEGVKLVKGLKKSGLVDAIGGRSTIGQLFADAIKGKVEGLQDKMIRKLPVLGDILADVRKGHIAGKKAEADEKQQQADVAHKDAEETNDAVEEVAKAAVSTAKNVKKQTAQGDKEYDAGEEEREENKKKDKDSFWKYKGPSMFGQKGKGGKGGSIGNILGEGLGTVLGGVIMKLPFGKLLGFLGPVLAKSFGFLGGLITSPAGLILGTAAAGFWAGGQLFKHWLGPMMDASFKKDMEARANARKQEIKDVTVMTERGKEQVYRIDGERMSEHDAITKLGGKKNLQKALADPDSGVIKETVRISATTGKVFGEGKEHFGSKAELGVFNKQDARNDAIARGEHGSKAQFLMNSARYLRNQEQFYLNIMSATYPNKASALKAEDTFENETADTKHEIDTRRGIAKELGLTSEYNAMLKEYPLALQASDGWFNRNFKADTEFIDNKWRVVGNLGSAFAGDITSEQYERDYGAPMAGSNDNIAALVAANAIYKSTGGGRGGGNQSTTIAPITSTVSVSNDNIFATSPITRNPEKTIQRVTYQ